MKDWKLAVKASYDTVADEYVRRIFNELKDKPLDQELLTQFAKETKPGETVCDLGCGPGHVGRFLRDCGATVVGLDLSPEMVAKAKHLNPDIPFQCDDITALSAGDAVWDGIVSFYSIVNIPPQFLTTAFREMYRVLKPGGRLFLVFHIGDQTVHLDDWWARKVSIDFFFLQTDSVVEQLEKAGFVLTEKRERDPYPDVEHPSRRAYLSARKPE